MQAASAKELATAVASSSMRRRPTLLGSPLGRRTIAVISVTGTAGCALRRGPSQQSSRFKPLLGSGLDSRRSTHASGSAPTAGEQQGAASVQNQSNLVPAS